MNVISGNGTAGANGFNGLNQTAGRFAGRVNLSHELLQDAGDEFANHLVADLARSVYNSESNLLLMRSNHRVG